jgi:serine/threonine protein kinase
MIEQRRSFSEDPGDDFSALAPCDLLDSYWEELQRQSSPELLRSRSSRGGHDQGFSGDLGVLSLLHQLRQSDGEGNPSQVRTVPLLEPLGSVLDPPFAGADRRDLPDHEGECAAPASPSPAGEASTATPAAPRQIGKYLVVELLDAGGQGQVFRVLHPELGKEYVLKLARRPSQVGINPEAEGAERSSLHREGRVLAQCDHPNLVRVVDLDAHEGRVFVVMEHVPGLNLEQFADQHRPSPRQAARLVAELARAVSYLHAREIVHQDIKPKNVLIDEQGSPRLIDFGLARQRHAWSSDSADAIGGTAVYMSPEQALGRADRIGPWTDVFGLGGLLYFLLTRRPLYQGASRASVQWQAMKAEYVPIRRINRKVPRSLERICRRALACDPERRYRTPVELEHALRGFLAGRWLAAAGLVAVCLVGLPAIAPRVRAPRIEPSSQPTAAPARAKIESFTIDHHGYRDGSWQWSIPIGLSPRPIVEGDGAFVSARLGAPGYGYLLALNPNGKVQLCQPSDPDESPQQSAQICFEESSYFPFNDGPGLQVFVVLASRRPLPPFARWSGRNWLSEHWRCTAADDVPGVWKHDGRSATLASSVPRGPMRKRPGPPEPFDEVCKYLATLPDIDAIEAIAFAVKPKEPAAQPSGTSEGSLQSASH